MVAVDFCAGFINEEAAVAVAIEGDAEAELIIGDEFLERCEVGAAAILIDFSVVIWVGVDELGFGAEFVEDRFADDGGGAIGAVDGYL